MVVDQPLCEGPDVRIGRVVERDAAECDLRHVLHGDVGHEVIVARYACSRATGTDGARAGARFGR